MFQAHALHLNSHWKTFEISKAKDMNIVICLGGFHLVMSFLGATGIIMEDWGLVETMELIYALNSIVHMLEGKAYARGLRCHLFIETLFQQILFLKVIADEKKIIGISLVKINQLYKHMI